MRTSTVEAVDTFARQLDRAQEEAKAALEQAADDMKWYYDRNRQVAPEYKVGDKAWLSLQNYSSNRPMKKLDHKWASVGGIIISYENRLLSIVLMVKACCHYCPDFYYKFDA